MTLRIMMWTQHLLGIGHLMRSVHVARALVEAGHSVLLASGGLIPRDISMDSIETLQLPPVRAKNELFDELVDHEGNEVTSGLLTARKDALVSAFHRFEPDCVITETFPFGRRLVQAEVLALIDAAHGRARRPKLVSSVRDVLQRPRKSERASAMVDLALSQYDAVLVHGDPQVIPADASFPEMQRANHLLRYTGYIGQRFDRSPVTRSEVIISAGGGAVGDTLIRVAAAARKLTMLADRPWTVVTGPLSQSDLGEHDGITFVRSIPNLSRRIAGAALSVSQAGYNTVVETLSGQTPAVLVPFETEREREQVTRAQYLAEKGLVSLVRARLLSPLSLAHAIDERYRAGMPPHSLNLDGMSGTVTAINALMEQR
jgi:predicted glycosyltransferase